MALARAVYEFFFKSRLQVATESFHIFRMTSNRVMEVHITFWSPRQPTQTPTDGKMWMC
jgi:hypothetical protein